MPQIPLYNRSATQTPEAPGAPVSSEAMEAPYRALAGLGGEVTETGIRLSQQKQQLEAAKNKAEASLLKLDLSNRMGLLKNQYESELSIRSDYDIMGTDADESLNSLKSDISDLLSDERLSKHPELAFELQSNAVSVVENAGIDARYGAIKELNNQGKATYNTTVESMIQRGDDTGVESATRLIKESPFHTDAEKQKLLVQIPKRSDMVAAEKIIASDPHSLSSASPNDIKAMFPNLNSDDIRAVKAHAKQNLNDQQNATIDNIYMPNSDYDKKTTGEKLVYLDESRKKNLLSASAYESERKRIREPSLADATPKDNEDYINLQAEIRGARGDKIRMAEILNKVTASTMPNSMRIGLYNEARDVQSPTSRINSSTAGLGHDLITTTFNRVKDDFAIDAVSKWFGLRGVSGFEEEDRMDMLIRAESEARQQYTSWLMSQKEMPSSQEIQAEVYSIIESVNKQYAVSKIPDRLREAAGFATEEQEIPQTEEEVDVSEIRRHFQ